MLAACTGIPTAESQCVKDCCHLEGETPVEIRIAVHRRKPKKDPQWHTGTSGSLYPEGISKLRDVGPSAGYADPFCEKYGNVPSYFPGEPHMPKMMYTYEQIRESNDDRSQGDFFSADSFAAPADDMEFAQVEKGSDSKLLPTMEVMRALSIGGKFSADLEDIYSFQSSPSKSSRSDMLWTPGSQPPEPRVPCLREGPMMMMMEEEYGAEHARPCEFVPRIRLEQSQDDNDTSCMERTLVRNSSGIFTPVSFNGPPPL